MIGKWTIIRRLPTAHPWLIGKITQLEVKDNPQSEWDYSVSIDNVIEATSNKLYFDNKSIPLSKLYIKKEDIYETDDEARMMALLLE